VPRYRDQLPSPPKGQNFREAYDWDSIEPSQEYVDLVGRVKNELRGLGLKIR
jgi:hypothetical protein